MHLKMFILSMAVALVVAEDAPISPRETWPRQMRFPRTAEPANRRSRPRLSSGERAENRRADVVPLLAEPALKGIQERKYNVHAKGVCHPQTITKYNTIYKERKANVFNKIEVRNPRPQVHKTKETRHTTIRYPIFITQVIKPLLTQVETKVKPVFFTKTLKRIKTILFTVTGIGQVTVTSVKYEKEFVTRCNKKGFIDIKGHHKGGHGPDLHHPHVEALHRKDDLAQLQKEDSEDLLDNDLLPNDRLDDYGEIYGKGQPVKTRSNRYKRELQASLKAVESGSSESSTATPRTPPNTRT